MCLFLIIRFGCKMNYSLTRFPNLEGSYTVSQYRGNDLQHRSVLSVPRAVLFVNRGQKTCLLAAYTRMFDVLCLLAKC